MNPEQINTISNYLNCDLSVVPVKKDKRPPMEWKHLQSDPMVAGEVDGYFTDSWGVALICGAVSDGLEIIDFDSHGKQIERIFERFSSDEKAAYIFSRHKVYVEKSPSGGYHVCYTHECDGRRDGNKKLAAWENNESMIETRGEGGYCIVAPTEGYVAIQGSIEELPRLSQQERDYLHDLARTFTSYVKPEGATEVDGTGFENTDPVSWFNWNKDYYAKKLLEDIGWRKLRVDESSGIEYWLRPGKEDDSAHSATWGKKHNALYVFSSSATPFEPSTYYTPFQILVKLKFKGNYRGATEWVITKYFEAEIPYIRVGIKYFKRILKMDRFGIDRVELKIWAKEEIKEDHGRGMVSKIPHFDDFTIVPNNFDYHPVVNNCYNLYREFTHKAVVGKWKWTEILLRHIFGDQYDLGIRYLQILYLHPDRLMPILVLVSRERQTGKTTFVNWLNMIFGDNMANIGPEDLANQFNAPYVASNIIAVEETLIEKDVTIEKIKALATSKFATVNEKHISQYRMPFFGKIILTSNNEDKFARIDQEEIRFFIRKVPLPTVANHNIEKDMVSEIPAFLHYLTSLPPVDWTVDRTGFKPSELENDMLREIKDESRGGMYKNISMKIEQMFLNECSGLMEFHAEPDSLKERFFSRDTRIDAPYIRRVLKNEFGMKPMKVTRFRPFGLDPVERVGRPFLFKRERFTDEDPIQEVPF